LHLLLALGLPSSFCGIALKLWRQRLPQPLGNRFGLGPILRLGDEITAQRRQPAGPPGRTAIMLSADSTRLVE
jgi:hypothetical protein